AFQFGQVLKYATRFAKAIGIATLHTKVLDETIENAMVNFADVVLELERRKTAEGPLARGGTLRLVKMGKTPIPSRGYYYEMTPQGIAIDRKSTRLNSSHEWISYAVFCLTK